MKKIGEILSEYLRKRGWPSHDPCSRIFLEWKTLVGEPLCDHTEPVEISDGILHIKADHPGWIQMVSLKKAYLLERIREMAPGADITEIKSQLGIRKR